jgi:hypothetical protein
MIHDRWAVQSYAKTGLWLWVEVRTVPTADPPTATYVFPMVWRSCSRAMDKPFSFHGHGGLAVSSSRAHASARLHWPSGRNTVAPAHGVSHIPFWRWRAMCCLYSVDFTTFSIYAAQQRCHAQSWQSATKGSGRERSFTGCESGYIGRGRGKQSNRMARLFCLQNCTSTRYTACVGWLPGTIIEGPGCK